MLWRALNALMTELPRLSYCDASMCLLKYSHTLNSASLLAAPAVNMPDTDYGHHRGHTTEQQTPNSRMLPGNYE
jgi:hypothetical protein